MESPTLIALSRQTSLRRQLDVIANNIANMNTTGFKAEHMLFEDHLKAGGGAASGDKMAFVRDFATSRNTANGELTGTGNPLDVAIRGDGYFAVSTPTGERYTRNGRFRIDPAGQLVTDHGHPVSGQGGAPITLRATDTRIAISRDGVISSENGDLGRLRIVSFENAQALRPVAGGLMASDEIPGEVATPEVEQGMLENSNVEPIREIARLIETQRSDDGARRFSEREDERMRKMIEAYTR